MISHGLLFLDRVQRQDNALYHEYLVFVHVLHGEVALVVHRDYADQVVVLDS